MYPLFETIRVENGQLLNLKWHQQRYFESFQNFYGIGPSDNIANNIVVPNEFCKGTYKLRISYNKTSKKVEYEKYNIKNIASLKLIEDNEILYNHKYSNRSDLDDLFSRRNYCDDILIVKNGMITDSSYCNIVFFDGDDWVTPSSPLLKGTARERLLWEKVIKEKIIIPKDLKYFSCFKLINAMRAFEKVEVSNIENIKE